MRFRSASHNLRKVTAWNEGNDKDGTKKQAHTHTHQSKGNSCLSIYLSISEAKNIKMKYKSTYTSISFYNYIYLSIYLSIYQPKSMYIYTWIYICLSKSICIHYIYLSISGSTGQYKHTLRNIIKVLSCRFPRSSLWTNIIIIIIIIILNNQYHQYHHHHHHHHNHHHQYQNQNQYQIHPKSSHPPFLPLLNPARHGSPPSPTSHLPTCWTKVPPSYNGSMGRA